MNSYVIFHRVASMQDGADRESRPSIMHENIRNLRKVWQSGKLWLIDNESGLFDGYDLMYRGKQNGVRFKHFHLQMLHTNCIFRRGMVDKLYTLNSVSSPEEALLQYVSLQEPLYKYLPKTKAESLYKSYFHTRLKEVIGWIEKCKSR